MKDKEKRLEESFTKKVVEYNKDSKKDEMKKTFGNMFCECLHDIQTYVSKCRPMLTYVAYQYFENFNVSYSVEHSDRFAAIIDKRLEWYEKPQQVHVALRSSMFPEGYIFDLQELCLKNVPEEDIEEIENLPVYHVRYNHKEIKDYDYSILIRDLHNVLKIVLNELKPFMKDPYIKKCLEGEDLYEIEKEKQKECNEIQRKLADKQSELMHIQMLRSNLNDLRRMITEDKFR